jgi:hypothetical protein
VQLKRPCTHCQDETRGRCERCDAPVCLTCETVHATAGCHAIPGLTCAKCQEPIGESIPYYWRQPPGQPVAYAHVTCPLAPSDNDDTAGMSR